MLREVRLTATGLVLSVALAGCGGGSQAAGTFFTAADGTPDLYQYNDLPARWDGNVNGFDPNNPTAYNIPAQCAPGTG